MNFRGRDRRGAACSIGSAADSNLIKPDGVPGDVEILHQAVNHTVLVDQVMHQRIQRLPAETRAADVGLRHRRSDGVGGHVSRRSIGLFGATGNLAARLRLSHNFTAT